MRQPSVNIYHAELSLLVGLMFNRYSWSDVPEVLELEPNDFIKDSHKWIFHIIKQLYEHGYAPTFWTVGLYLLKAFPKQYEAVKGDVWFREKVDEYGEMAMCAPHIRQWARDVKRESNDRREQMGLPVKQARKRSINIVRPEV